MFDRIDERNAYHEAGHAVASHLVHRPFKKVSAYSDFLGRRRWYQGDYFDILFYGQMSECRLDAERLIVVALAGPMAEAKYLGTATVESPQLNEVVGRPPGRRLKVVGMAV